MLVEEPLALEGAGPALALPSLLLRTSTLPVVVRVHVPAQRIVAFSGRDLRSPSIRDATAVARAHGFAAVVRSPGGRVVAYDGGAVVVDHVARVAGPGGAGPVFEDNARSHAAVLRSVSDVDVRVGELPGEYCPGEFSLNAGGVAKVVGSAQRLTGRASLFSTVVQVSMSPAVRAVIEDVSAALTYPLDPTTVAGLTDFDPTVTTEAVARALRADYVSRLGLVEGPLPEALVAQAASAGPAPGADPGLPFVVDDWARAEVSRPRPRPPG